MFLALVVAGRWRQLEWSNGGITGNRSSQMNPGPAQRLGSSRFARTSVDMGRPILVRRHSAALV
jgi:hypothetical protein